MVRLFFAILLSIPTTLTAGAVPDGKCAFTVASRQSMAEVRSYIASDLHSSHRPYLRVARTTNGWYAISVGDVPRQEFESIKSRLLSRGEVPRDSFCSNGNSYTGIIPRGDYIGNTVTTGSSPPQDY